MGQDGTGQDGTGWVGMRQGGMGRDGMERDRMGRSGMGWERTDRNAMGWNTMGWSRTGWEGTGGGQHGRQQHGPARGGDSGLSVSVTQRRPPLPPASFIKTRPAAARAGRGVPGHGPAGVGRGHCNRVPFPPLKSWCCDAGGCRTAGDAARFCKQCPPLPPALISPGLGFCSPSRSAPRPEHLPQEKLRGKRGKTPQLVGSAASRGGDGQENCSQLPGR